MSPSRSVRVFFFFSPRRALCAEFVWQLAAGCGCCVGCSNVKTKTKTKKNREGKKTNGNNKDDGGEVPEVFVLLLRAVVVVAERKIWLGAQTTKEMVRRRRRLLAFVFAQTKVGDRAANTGRHQIGRRVVMMMVGVVLDLVQRDQLVVEGVGRFHFHRRHRHDAHRPSAHLR